MPEQQNIEFKQSWHDDYLKWVCGFANAIGGIIYIGKDNNGKVLPLSNYAKLMDDIPNKIRNSMGIICDVQYSTKPGENTFQLRSTSLNVPINSRRLIEICNLKLMLGCENW